MVSKAACHPLFFFFLRGTHLESQRQSRKMEKYLEERSELQPMFCHVIYQGALVVLIA
jgi:hypothetical protein